MPQDIMTAVRDDAVRRLPWQRRATTNLHIQQAVLRNGSVIRAHRQEIPVTGDTIMVFADDAPRLNWSHACRYLLYNATSAELYREVPAQFPPYLTEVPADFVAFHQPVR